MKNQKIEERFIGYVKFIADDKSHAFIRRIENAKEIDEIIHQRSYENDFRIDEKIEDFIDEVFQSNIDLRKENIDNIPGEGQLVIDEQKIDQTHLEKIVMSFEVNRLNVGIEMCCQYNLKAHRYTDENA